MNPWPLRALKDIATVSVGVVTPTRREVASPFEKEYPVVSVGSLQQMGIVPRDTLARLPLTPGAAERAMLQADNVLLSARGAALRIALVGREHEGAVASSTLLVIRPRGEVSGATIYAALRTPAVARHLEQIARTSTATRAWRPSDVAEIAMPVPPVRVQEMVRQLVEADIQHLSAAQRALELRQRIAGAVLAEVLYGKADAGR